MSNENYLKKLFIDEAKPALQRHSGGGGTAAVEPLEVTENGVYDATRGVFKYGETVTLRRHIPDYEYAALSAKLVAANVTNIVGDNLRGFAMNGLVFLQAITDDGLPFGYFHSSEHVAAFGLGDEFVGEWAYVGGSLDEAYIGEALPFTLPTEEEYAKLGVPIEQSNLQCIFAEPLFHKGGEGGYNPVTVNVPIPDGYHKSEDATAIYPEDIRYGLTAYANGKVITGTSLVPSGKLRFTTPYGDEIGITIPSYIYIQIDGGEIVEGCNLSFAGQPVYDDAGNQVDTKTGVYEVTVFNSYHESVTAWNKIISDMSYIYNGYKGGRWSIEDMDVRNFTTLTNAFYYKSTPYMPYLESVSFKHSENIKDIYYAFYNQSQLVSVKGLDLRNARNVLYAFYGCTALKELELKNIALTLTVGSSTLYGHLLTVDSLVHLIYELRDTGSSRTLTVGSANLEKLASVYVKTVEITDEMRAEDDLVDEKLPFVVCESTDEGAILITEYVVLKNWKLA